MSSRPPKGVPARNSQGLPPGPVKAAGLDEHIKSLGAPKRDFIASMQPLMLATLYDQPVSGPEWIFEVKFDGIRVLAARKGGRVELYGRNNTVITTRYPEICKALENLSVDQFVIDGEIIALDERGRPSFQRLQGRMHLASPHDVERAMVTSPVEAVFFDCLQVQGLDLRSIALIERKNCLTHFLPRSGPVRYSDYVHGKGEEFFKAVCEQGLEGIVAKRVNSRYIGTRSRDWLKIKCQQRQEFVIGGYTDPQGGRSYFGALHLGLYQNSKLIYVSKVGTGFDLKTLKLVWDKLQPLERATSPFDVKSPRGRGHHWVEPKLVCEVRFTEWTHDGGIRHPAFLGLRTDKNPEDCRKEEPAAPSPSSP